MYTCVLCTGTDAGSDSNDYAVCRTKGCKDAGKLDDILHGL